MNHITIIMPLYNAERYLEECLDSVLAQSFRDFELICVDDASDDSTRDILTHYQSRDSRIKILVNSERDGAAWSRNRAMKEAKGEYLTFLDGDDVFAPDMLKVAYETAKKYQADVVEYQYKAVQSEMIHVEARIKRSENFKRKFCRKTFRVADMKPHEFMHCHSAPWNKLYRKEMIENECLMFQELSCCNDVYFVLMSLMLADRIVFTDDDRVMVYVRQHNTPSRVSYDRDPMNAYLADQKIGETLVSKGQMPQLYAQFFYRTFCHLTETLRNLKSRERAEEFYGYLQKEGIGNLCKLGGDCYRLLGEEIRNKLEMFQTTSYETGWYKHEGEFLNHLEDNTEKVTCLFAEWKQKSMNVALWGAGRNGRAFLKFCIDRNLVVDWIVDADKNKWGEKITENLVITNPRDVLEDVQVVILTSSNIAEEITAEAKRLNSAIQVIDINEYLG